MATKAKSAGPASDVPTAVPFEEALRQLESIVETMEAGDLPLETLVSRYEEGTRLVKVCQAKLQEAELKIQTLEKNADGEPVLRGLTESTTPEEDEQT